MQGSKKGDMCRLFSCVKLYHKSAQKSTKHDLHAPHLNSSTFKSPI